MKILVQKDKFPLTNALLTMFVAIIFVLSNWSVPGPWATHNLAWPLHVLVTVSHGSPVFRQWGPFKLGDTSPRLVEAKAPTNVDYHNKKKTFVLYLHIYECRWLTFPGKFVESMVVSSRIEAYPTLSDVTKQFELFIEVGWTANHWIAPNTLLSEAFTIFSWTISVSVLLG